MKYLILLLISSVCYANAPQRKAGDILIYNVPEFYKNVCDGKGMVISYTSEYKGVFTFERYFTYKLKDLNPNCPIYFWVTE